MRFIQHEPQQIRTNGNTSVQIRPVLGTLDSSELDAAVASAAADAAAADASADAALASETAAAASAASSASGATSAAASATAAAASEALAELIVGLPSEDAAVAFLVDDSGSDTTTALQGGFVPQRTGSFDVPDGILVGNRATAAGGSARLLFELAHNVNDPDEVILQHYSGYSFYTGTQVGTGSLQGASDQSVAWLGAGGAFGGAVLGYEGIGELNGDDPSGTFGQPVIGLQGTALIGGTPDAPLLVSVQASGPRESTAYTGTLDEARSLNVQEPTVGDVRRASYSVGTARFVKGVADNVLELADAGDTLQWASDGALLTGFASDGSTERVVLDPQDGATQRTTVNLSGAVKGAVSNAIVGATGNHFEAQIAGAKVFAVKHDGTLDLTLSSTATSPTNGSAGATPASPWFYAVAVVNGNNVRIPCYFDF